MYNIIYNAAVMLSIVEVVNIKRGRTLSQHERAIRLCIRGDGQRICRISYEGLAYMSIGNG